MIKGARIYIDHLKTKDVYSVFDLEIKNKPFFSQFAPNRDSDFYTLEGQMNRIQKMEENREKDIGYSFGIFLQDTHELIGQVGFFKVERGPAQKGMIGYSLDQAFNGNGYMTEALELMVNYGFNELKFHRIEAEVMPHNIGSIKILEKTGFHKEGIARQNVMINGKWEDHQVLALINPNY
ncbi:alanine acetyltransferase [Fictibacillus phosphorivorans]|uniref:Alanine acetyltransferase n=1 Tax=Fictibacillus phosphorivorans TaxID=1221500 RepID=A0A165P760_9BACL|nr:GNAT family protein [Fictibacillus phosphorivorans]KZE69213.1 alanine acetyltransferase [Fictibacillus phosphorivorans]